MDTAFLRYDFPSFGPGPAAATAGSARPLVFGPENRLLAAVPERFFEEAGKALSPLVIYGPTGVGKSSLAAGLARECAIRNPNERWRVESAGEFCAEFQQAAHDRQLDVFLAPYRALDGWVLDDLDRMAAAPAVQAELVRLIDGLLDQEKRLIVVLPSVPRRCEGLTKALADRLCGGLIVPLAPPAPGTRRALLEIAAERLGVSVPEALVARWADEAAGPREIESAVQEFRFRVRTASGDILADPGADRFPSLPARPAPTLPTIAARTAAEFAVRVADLRSPSRQATTATARALAMFLARELTPATLHDVAAYFRRKDHTTVLHACKATAARIDADARFADRADRIRRQVMAPLAPKSRAKPR